MPQSASGPLLGALLDTNDDLLNFWQLRAHWTDGAVEHHRLFSDPSRRIRNQLEIKTWRRVGKRGLGQGAFGTVYLEQEKNGELRAVKEVVQKTTSKDEVFEYLREVLTMANLAQDDGYFVKLYGWFSSPHAVHIAMEYAPHGDLHDCVKEPLIENEVQLVTRQLVEALEVLHFKKFAHRDLKPSNVFVIEKGPSWWVKLGDFGVSKRVANEMTRYRTSIDTDFTAPEVIGFVGVGDDEETSSYTNAVDIWSLGCLVHWMLTHTLPVNRRRLNAYCMGLIELPQQHLDRCSVSNEGVEFLKTLLQPRPESRPSASNISKEAWLLGSQTHLLSDTQISLDIGASAAVENIKPLTDSLADTQAHFGASTGRGIDMSRLVREFLQIEFNDFKSCADFVESQPDVLNENTEPIRQLAVLAYIDRQFGLVKRCIERIVIIQRYHGVDILFRKVGKEFCYQSICSLSEPGDSQEMYKERFETRWRAVKKEAHRIRPSLSSEPIGDNEQLPDNEQHRSMSTKVTGAVNTADNLHVSDSGQSRKALDNFEPVRPKDVVNQIRPATDAERQRIQSIGEQVPDTAMTTGPSTSQQESKDSSASNRLGRDQTHAVVVLGSLPPKGPLRQRSLSEKLNQGLLSKKSSHSESSRRRQRQGANGRSANVNTQQLYEIVRRAAAEDGRPQQGLREQSSEESIVYVSESFRNTDNLPVAAVKPTSSPYEDRSSPRQTSASSRPADHNTNLSPQPAESTTNADPSTGSHRTKSFKIIQHSGRVDAVAFSPDGALIASGSRDGIVRLWHVSDRKSHRVLEGHQSCVLSVAFSPDGKLLVSGSMDRLVLVWDITTRTRHLTLRTHRDIVTSVAFSPDGSLIASGSHDTTVRLWYVTSGKRRVLSGHKANVTQVAFSPDGALVASSSWDRTIRIWDVATAVAVHTLEEQRAAILSIAFNLDPTHMSLVSSSYDHTVRVWYMRPEFTSYVIEDDRYKSSTRSVAFSPSGKMIVAGSCNGVVRLYHQHARNSYDDLGSHRDFVSSVAFSPDGKLVVSGSHDSTVRIWDVAIDIPAQDAATIRPATSDEASEPATKEKTSKLSVEKIFGR